ncbi:Variable outer membrane protein (plasmid) [Borrelia hermsii MTW]|uniref:Variable large protein n=2 Tax=Borrelia hermsii TaxID=140 RepID=W5T750_BORHE|nr:Variable outer membrane protein [Borrelia hermsii MTW]
MLMIPLVMLLLLMVLAGNDDKLVKGIKSIVEVALKKGSADVGDVNKVKDSSIAKTSDKGETGKLFTKDNAGAGCQCKEISNRCNKGGWKQ